MPDLEQKKAFPPYTFVPGASPHPIRDPKGHSYGLDHERFGAPPCFENWKKHRLWLYQLSLFNKGYYWEAHEGFEVWWGMSEEEPMRCFFRALLRLAAAGVKARQGNAAGLRRHSTQAALLFEASGQALEAIAPAFDVESGRFLGLNLRVLGEEAELLALRAERVAHLGAQCAGVENVLGMVLKPESARDGKLQSRRRG